MSTLNELMDKRAEEYTNVEIDQIIAHVRKQLAAYDAGEKPKREAEENFDMGKIIGNILKKPAAPERKMKRRF